MDNLAGLSFGAGKPQQLRIILVAFVEAKLQVLAVAAQLVAGWHDSAGANFMDTPGSFVAKETAPKVGGSAIWPCTLQYHPRTTPAAAALAAELS